MDKYAKIIVDISQEQLDKTFQYRIPEKLEQQVLPGVTVKVPFGRRVIQGFVLEVSEVPEFDVSKTKDIISVETGRNVAEGRLIQLAVWMKENFGSTLNQALKTVMPVKEKVSLKAKKTIRLVTDKDTLKKAIEASARKRHYVKQQFLEVLYDDEVMEYSLVTNKLNVSLQTIKNLEKNGFISIEEVQYYRNPVKENRVEEKAFEYTDQQQAAIDKFVADYDNGHYKTYLLHGVTGSGKTEVYMAMIEKVIAMKRQAIVLIPEIALTYQTVTRFYKRFGDRVSIINSRLSKGERYDQFCRAKNGDIDIMIGPRSALFTPFNDVGIIIIDEEHESAYKSETSPRYNAKMVAEYIAARQGASLVLGSATPSVETYYETQNGNIELMELSRRATGARLPEVEVVDLREELKNGNRSILSRKLTELIKDRLQKKEQIMLFLNKRGYSGFISCRSCGAVMKCPHCDISLTYHTQGRSRGKMVCHFCGYETEAVKSCPECGSQYVSGFKAGTQQIADIVQKAFPCARILRMDADTTTGKDGHQKILSAFASGDADILIGTQMIVKGHDFPAVTLVGILAADMSLYASDYDAAQKTFQLLTQAAGRAGRGSIAGNVVIQTYNPEHYSIVAAANQDYAGFYEQEIGYRKMAGYPPVKKILMVTFSSEDEKILEHAVALIRPHRDNLVCIGPANASIYKLKDVYNKVLYIKSADYSALTEFAKELDNYVKNSTAFKKVMVQFSFMT